MFSSGVLLAIVATIRLSGAAAPKVREVVVGSSRVHVGDLVAGLTPETGRLDLGPAPAAFGSRIIEREDIIAALRAHNMPELPGLPASVRILRKMKRLEVTDVEQIVQEGLRAKLPHGLTLDAVRPAAAVSVPDGWTRVTAEIPRPPHRAGAVRCDASVTFYEDSQPLCVLSVPVELTVSREAAMADVQHGARISLVIRRGLVEVTSAGTAGADADVGGIVPIVLHPSGRTILARLEDNAHAIALDAQ
jgi:hypothetical protein